MAAGRAFCIHLYAATAGVKGPLHYIKITREFKEDLQVWHTFLQSCNGGLFWRQPMAVQAELQVHSDAVGGTVL